MSINDKFDFIAKESKAFLNFAGEYTEKVYSSSKAHVEKAHLKSKLKEKYCRLGELCFEMSEKDADVSGEIKRIVAEIKALKVELDGVEEQVKKPKVCTVCGNKNKADNDFCTKCGERL